MYIYIYIRSDRGGHRLAVVTNNIYIYIYHQAPRLQGRALRLTWTKLNCTRTRLHNVTTVDVHMSVYIYIYIYSVCIYIYMAITSGDTTEYIYISPLSPKRRRAKHQSDISECQKWAALSRCRRRRGGGGGAGGGAAAARSPGRRPSRRRRTSLWRDAARPPRRRPSGRQGATIVVEALPVA